MVLTFGLNLEDRFLRAASHYGHRSQEAVELSGQTLLGVQINGLKKANKS
jgi:hypothetical protein